MAIVRYSRLAVVKLVRLYVLVVMTVENRDVTKPSRRTICLAGCLDSNGLFHRPRMAEHAFVHQGGVTCDAHRFPPSCPPHICTLACVPAAVVVLLRRARAVTHCMHICKLALV